MNIYNKIKYFLFPNINNKPLRLNSNNEISAEDLILSDLPDATPNSILLNNTNISSKPIYFDITPNSLIGRDITGNIVNYPLTNFLFSNSPLSNILFVSANAPIVNDSNTREQALGRIDKPFRTINAAHLISTNNDIIYVLSGDYSTTQMSVSNANRSSRFILDNCNITTTSGFLNVTGSGYTNNSFISLTNSNITSNASIINGTRVMNVFGNNKDSCTLTSTTTITGSSINCLFTSSTKINASNLTINSFNGVVLRGVNGSSFINCIVNCAFFVLGGQWVQTLENCIVNTTNNYMSGTSTTYGLIAKNCTLNTILSTTAGLSTLNLKYCELNTDTFINESATTNASYFIIENCRITCNTLISKNSTLINKMQFLNNVFKCNTIINNVSNTLIGNYNFVNNISNVNFDSFELTNPANVIINHNILNQLQ